MLVSGPDRREAIARVEIRPCSPDGDCNSRKLEPLPTSSTSAPPAPGTAFCVADGDVALDSEPNPSGRGRSRARGLAESNVALTQYENCCTRFATAQTREPVFRTSPIAWLAACSSVTRQNAPGRGQAASRSTGAGSRRRHAREALGIDARQLLSMAVHDESARSSSSRRLAKCGARGAGSMLARGRRNEHNVRSVLWTGRTW